MCTHVYGTIYSISTVEGSEGSVVQQQNFRFPRFFNNNVTSIQKNLFSFTGTVLVSSINYELTLYL